MKKTTIIGLMAAAALSANAQMQITGNGIYISTESAKSQATEAMSRSASQLSQITPVKFNKVGANAANQRFGFDVKEVEAVMPELVIADESGKKYVNYIGLVPVLVDAVKELKAEVEMLRSLIPDPPAQAASAEDVADNSQPYLKQNMPNPFSVSSTISYRLPKGAAEACVRVFDMNGTLKATYPIAANAPEGALTISASELPAGMYFYALIADGREIAVKRMILTD